jgi:uncharacterized membrane protein YbhN (UPF0104 family)
LKNYLIAAAKISVSLLILAALFWFAFRKNGNQFFAMLAAPKRWEMLLAAWIVVLVAVLITIVRWCYLVRAVGIPLSIKDSLRIGFLGYLFNLAPLGIVGGDLFKAVILAHEWRARGTSNRAKALASVFVDRIVGLEVLFLVASLGVVTGKMWHDPDRVSQLICTAVLITTAISTVGLTICMIPGVLDGPLFKAFERLPKVGHAAHSLLESLRIYRRDIPVLFFSGLATLPVHLLLAMSLYFLARGLRFDTLSAVDFIGIYAISNILLVIPLPAGPAEGAVQFIYATAVKLSLGAAMINDKDLQDGLMIGLAAKLIAVSLAVIGMAFYFFGDRKEFREVIEESNEPQDDSQTVKA